MKKLYGYLGSMYPLDQGRASTTGDKQFNNLEEMKKWMNKNFKYFIIFKGSVDNPKSSIMYIKKGRYN